MVGNTIGLMEEHIFFDHVGVSVDIDATADQITGAADVGLVAVTIGSTHPVDNFLVFDARLDIEMVGTDADGVYRDRVMLGTVLDALFTSFSDTEDGNSTNPSYGVSSLIGRMDLTGGIVTNGEGRGVASSGDEVGSLADVQRLIWTAMAETARRLPSCWCSWEIFPLMLWASKVLTKI